MSGRGHPKERYFALFNQLGDEAAVAKALGVGVINVKEVLNRGVTQAGKREVFTGAFRCPSCRGTSTASTCTHCGTRINELL